VKDEHQNKSVVFTAERYHLAKPCFRCWKITR